MNCLEKIFLAPCSDREIEAGSSQKDIEDILSKIALEALNSLEHTLLQTAIIAGKIVLIPLELGCIALLITVRAVTILFYPKGAEDELFTVPNLMTALLNDLIEALWITYDFGNAPESERLKQTDAAGKGPQYIVIQPEHPSQIARPIIYAPGYLDQAETLRRTCRRIANATGNPVYAVKYKSYFQSIKEHAKDIALVAKEILKEHAQSKLTLIGHSMGGIAVECYIHQNRGVLAWATIASPRSGTPVAYFGVGTCAEEMRPNSSLLKENQESDALDDIPELHIQTLTDVIVPFTPIPEVTRPNVTHYTCKAPHGHLSLRSSPEVETLIIDELTRLYQLET